MWQFLEKLLPVVQEAAGQVVEEVVDQIVAEAVAWVVEQTIELISGLFD